MSEIGRSELRRLLDSCVTPLERLLRDHYIELRAENERMLGLLRELYETKSFRWAKLSETVQATEKLLREVDGAKEHGR